MTLMDLKEQVVKNKTLQNLYVFTGEETSILNTYVNKITTLFETKYNGNVSHIDSIMEVYNKFGKTNLLKMKPTCYVIYEDKNYISQNESVWKSLTTGGKKLLKDNVVIFIYNNIDKKTKFYKAHKDYITLFDKLSNDLLIKYIKKEFPTITTENADILVGICRNDYTRILLECNKLKNLQNAMQFQDINNCFNYALQQSFIYIPPEDAIFSFVSACLSRNIDDCYYYLNECKLIGENELNILSNLYTNFRALFQVQSLGYNKDVCNITGLQFYQVKAVSDKTKNYTLEELLRALRLIHYCEKSIKEGIMESTLVLDFMLVNLL